MKLKGLSKKMMWAVAVVIAVVVIVAVVMMTQSA